MRLRCFERLRSARPCCCSSSSCVPPEGTADPVGLRPQLQSTARQVASPAFCSSKYSAKGFAMFTRATSNSCAGRRSLEKCCKAGLYFLRSPAFVGTKRFVFGRSRASTEWDSWLCILRRLVLARVRAEKFHRVALYRRQFLSAHQLTLAPRKSFCPQRTSSDPRPR